jgi:putative phosphoribosyl transferase
LVPAKVFANRTEAGAQLAVLLAARQSTRPVVVLALPRGGVPVGFEIARALRAPLDVMLVRKIGMPGQPEFAIGAIASGDVIVRDRAGFAFSDEVFTQITEKERAELKRRELAYRPSGKAPDLEGKAAILVDDGIATGATMLAAARAARQAGAAQVVVAAPVAAMEAAARLEKEADGVVLLHRPPFFMSISEWYEDFGQLEDDEVRRLLDLAQSTFSES